MTTSAPTVLRDRVTTKEQEWRRSEKWKMATITHRSRQPTTRQAYPHRSSKEVNGDRSFPATPTIRGKTPQIVRYLSPTRDLQ